MIGSFSDSAEILCIDDGSMPEFLDKNKSVQNIAGVKYLCLKENVGRSKVRNLLFEKAKNNICIFLDNDSSFPDPLFVKRYFDNIQKGKVLCGGTLYDRNPYVPYSLHTRFGILRESLKVEARNQKPFQSFKSNNFCILKTDFSKKLFNEKIKSYGHEDSEFSSQVKKAGLQVIHIDNPVIHIGLMSNKEFLHRQLSAVENLYYLNTTGSSLDSNLWKVFKKLEKFRIVKNLLKSTLSMISKSLQSRLESKGKPLIYMDLLKLLKLLEISDQKLKH